MYVCVSAGACSCVLLYFWCSVVVVVLYAVQVFDNISDQFMEDGTEAIVRRAIFLESFFFTYYT